MAYVIEPTPNSIPYTLAPVNLQMRLMLKHGVDRIIIYGEFAIKHWNYSQHHKEQLP